MAGMLSFFTLQGVEGCTFASRRGELTQLSKCHFAFPDARECVFSVLFPVWPGKTEFTSPKP